MKLRNLIAVSDFFSCLKNLESNWESGSYPGKKKRQVRKTGSYQMIYMRNVGGNELMGERVVHVRAICSGLT